MNQDEINTNAAGAGASAAALVFTAAFAVVTTVAAAEAAAPAAAFVIISSWFLSGFWLVSDWFWLVLTGFWLVFWLGEGDHYELLEKRNGPKLDGPDKFGKKIPKSTSQNWHRRCHCRWLCFLIIFMMWGAKPPIWKKWEISSLKNEIWYIHCWAIRVELHLVRWGLCYRRCHQTNHTKVTKQTNRHILLVILY